MADLSRRSLLGLGLAAGVTALTAGCSTPGTTSVNTAPLLPAADGPVRLTYWAWLKDLQKVCDVWNASHPDIQVDAVWIPGGNAGGYQKLYSALAAGGGPDIGQVEMRTIPEFLLVNGLVDLRRYGADDIAADYNATLWQQVSFVDGVYGIPQDSGPMGLYYRPDLFEQVGARPPATWDEWAEVAGEIRGLDAYLDCFALNDASWFAAMATQAGASWFSVDGDEWSVNMTDDATLETADFFDRAIDDDLVTVAYGQYSPPWYAAAANDGIAGAVGASWGDALMQSIAGAEGKWRVAPMPRWGSVGAETGFGSTFQGGSTAAVMASSRHPRESLEFLHWMTTSEEGIDAMIANSGIGWSPNDAYIGEQREQPSEFFGGQSYNEEVFVPAAREQNADWQWWPLTQQSFNILSDGFRRKASGVTLVDSIAQAEDDIVRAFRNKGLSIRKASA
jgi:multiple sugar transport system substrate-binding protein